MPLIKESFSLVATDADILAAPSRLAAIPGQGSLTFEVSASDADLTNFGTLTLQLPDGSIPFEDLLIPFSGSSAEQQMDSLLQLSVTMSVPQGGHVLLSYTENGTVAFILIYATLTF